MKFNKIFLINLIVVINLINCAETPTTETYTLYIHTNSNNEIILGEDSKISVNCYIKSTGPHGTHYASFSGNADENVFLNENKSIKKTGDVIFLFNYHFILKDDENALEKYFNKKKTKCVIL